MKLVLAAISKAFSDNRLFRYINKYANIGSDAVIHDFHGLFGHSGLWLVLALPSAPFTIDFYFALVDPGNLQLLKRHLLVLDVFDNLSHE